LGRELFRNQTGHPIRTGLLQQNHLLWRAVDQHGIELDILLQKRRDTAAAKRFFQRLLAQYPNGPRKIITDQLRSYPAAKAGIPDLADVKHVFVKAAARVNNRGENSHQPTRDRERRMKGFRSPGRTQQFLFCFGPIRQHFMINRQRRGAAQHRNDLTRRFAVWQHLT
jgi:putative transposase